MRRLSLIALFAALVLVAAACGSDSDSDSSSPTSATDSGSTATSAAAGASASAVAISDTSLGSVAVDGDGMTLYVFTPDTGTESTCYDACASAWPALVGPATAGDGLEADDLGTTTRTDGTVQVTFYGHPVYHYAGDGAPGDVSGQGVGGKWFVVDADGTAITETSSSSTTAKARSGY